MENNISNLLAQGYARTLWYKKGVEDANKNAGALFHEQIQLTVAEANIQTYKNAAKLASNASGYGLYDKNTGFITIQPWKQTIETLIKSYNDEEYALAEIASVLTTKKHENLQMDYFYDSSDKILSEKNKIFVSSWFLPSRIGSAPGNFEDAYEYAGADRQFYTYIEGFKKKIRGIKFADLTLIRIEKGYLDSDKTFVNEGGGGGKLEIEGEKTHDEWVGELLAEENRTSDKELEEILAESYPAAAEEKTKQEPIFEKQKKTEKQNKKKADEEEQALLAAGLKGDSTKRSGSTIFSNLTPVAKGKNKKK